MATSPSDERAPLLPETSNARRRLRLVAVGVATVGAGALVALAAGRRPAGLSNASLVAPGRATDSGAVDVKALEANGDDTVYLDASACNTVDDDAHWGSVCPSADFHTWCNGGETQRRIEAICPDACASETTAYMMPCAWMAVKSLPDICAETYVPSLNENTPSQNLAPGSTTAQTTLLPDQSQPEPNYQPPEDGVQLWACDAHAVCYACQGGQDGTTTDDRYCSAVSSYYGGTGIHVQVGDSPFKQATATTHPGYEDQRLFIGANAAMRAMVDDRDFWCASETLDAIAAGTFDKKLDRSDPIFFDPSVRASLEAAR